MEVLNRKKVNKSNNPRIGREPKYSFEFMRMIGKAVVEDGMKYREVARVFGCSHGLVNNAKKLYLSGVPTSGYLQTGEASLESIKTRLEDEVRDLKEEIGELYIENRMLKKAMRFSQQIKKESSSVITSENLDQFQEDVK